MMKSKKRVIVCDYDNPKGYTFPSFGFGSSFCFILVRHTDRIVAWVRTCSKIIYE